MLSAVVRDHGDYQHTNTEMHSSCASADTKPAEDDRVVPTDAPSASGQQGQVCSLHQETQCHGRLSSSSVPPSPCSWAQHGHVQAAQEAELPQLGRLLPFCQGPSGGHMWCASLPERTSRPMQVLRWRQRKAGSSTCASSTMTATRMSLLPRLLLSGECACGVCVNNRQCACNQ